MLERTGGRVADHQRWTLERYDKSFAVLGDRLMPVLQGYEPREYVEHLLLYGDRLSFGMWVGVGSVCKRNGHPSSVLAVLRAIREERPDLNLHGFGLKRIALQLAGVRDLLYSADSMAWSFAARYEGRDGNSVKEAQRYARMVEEQSIQETLL